MSQEENVYERFRTILTMNLCNVLQKEQLEEVLKTVDISLHDFELVRKKLEIIQVSGTPEVVKHYLASQAIANKSMKTLKQYQYKLINFFHDLPKSYMDITTNDIRVYLYNFKVAHNAGDRYLDNIRGVINTFFQWLVDNDYLQKNPCAKVDKIKYQEKRRKPMTSYELEYFRFNTENVREKALIDFFFSTGLRVSECVDVNLDDIDWGTRSVIVRHGKGDKQRVVYFNAESEVSLRKYLDSRDDSNNALFVSVRKPHDRIKQRALENIIGKVSERTGIHAYPHMLRHTFATFGLHSGMPIDKLQVLLGHSKPETTMIYADEDKTDLIHEYSRVYA